MDSYGLYTATANFVQATGTPAACYEAWGAGMRFAVGNKVVFKADPDRVGVVTRVDDGGPEPRYTVFMINEEVPAYESQLALAEDARPELTPSTLEGLHALLTATQLTQPGMSSLYSLNAGRIDFVPYQFRPVLQLIRSDRPRLLIADEVGLGKTIEAGLILRELRARQQVDSVLVVCPKSLVTERKWEDELRRFGEGFETLDGVSLRRCLVEMDLEGEWPERFSRSILPSSLFSDSLLNGFEGKGRRAPVKGLTQLDPPPGFDLLIVDEAHHLRNPETYLHQGIRILAERSHTVLFLTATPINLGDQDLFHLLNVLRPDLIIDRETFQRITEPNPHINAACEAARAGDDGWEGRCVKALDAVEDTDWGRNVTTSDPRFQASRRSLVKAPLARREGHKGFGWGRHRGHSFGRHIEGWIAFLKAELKITEQQQPRWEAFADALRDSATRWRRLHDEMGEAREKAEEQGTEKERKPKSAVERLERWVTFAELGLETARSFHAAFKPLYEEMTVDQKQQADMLLHRWPSR